MGRELKASQDSELTLGSYKILGQIGEGGFAKTYKAQHNLLGTLVCIKYSPAIDEQSSKIVTKEAQALWDLRHYALPAMRDVIQLPDKRLAIVMSYIPGPTLEQLVHQHSALEPEHVAWISSRMLDALRYLHYHGVMHGDVKPSNIIIQPETHGAVLVDYGLAAIRPSMKDHGNGYTPLFSAPEQLTGLPILPETDLYCLGLTMIYALGGDIAKRKIPEKTPKPMMEFIKGLIVYDIRNRPNWQKLDLVEQFTKVREASFGRRRSQLLKLPATT